MQWLTECVKFNKAENSRQKEQRGKMSDVKMFWSLCAECEEANIRIKRITTTHLQELHHLQEMAPSENKSNMGETLHVSVQFLNIVVRFAT